MKDLGLGIFVRWNHVDSYGSMTMISCPEIRASYNTL
jgi:hypothetical protein